MRRSGTVNTPGLCAVVSLLLLPVGLASPALVALWPLAAQAQIICVSNVTPPPEIPVYDQPPIPDAGYLWIPGYWASGPNGYFWVPGTWVLPPAAGLLWTPGYWAWRDGIYVWNAGYWGPRVGFYGGIDYGFGYGGAGYEGGRWDNGVFVYNRAVNNFGAVAIAHFYEKPVVVEATVRVSFNGGAGGTTVRPTAEQEAAAREAHVAALPAQFTHERVASADKALLASENHGRPSIAATPKPGEFAKGATAAREVAPATAVPPARPGAVEVTPHPLEPKIVPREERPAERPAPQNAAIPPKPLPPEVKSPAREMEHKPPPPPEQAAVKPAPPPARPAPPTPAAATPPAPVPHAAPPPAPAGGKPACPPGKTLAEVNGHPVCR
jgi:hypothetical protein